MSSAVSPFLNRSGFKRSSPRRRRISRPWSSLRWKNTAAPSPPAFRQYLLEMGTEDGGILSRHMGEEWRGDQNGLNTASRTKHYMEYKTRMGRGFEDFVQDRSPGCPPFWNFFHAALAEQTCGFSPCTDDPDELVHSDAWRFYYPQYTFSKLLFYCAYSDLLRWVLTNGKSMRYRPGTLRTCRSQSRFPTPSWSGRRWKKARWS